MEEKKLTKDERASDFDKVLLITGHINWMANNLHGITRDYEYMFSRPEIAEQLFETHRQRLDWNKELMAEVVKELNVVREKIADYLNGCDAVSSIDMSLSEPIYNIINDLEED